MIVLHESRHLREHGFFRFLFSSVRKFGGQVRVDESRPVPPWRDLRGEHNGAWISWRGKRVFFDMSDHVFQFDREAWSTADLYFKANLNRSIAAELLPAAGEEPEWDRLRAFCFFPPSLVQCRRLRFLAGICRRSRPTACHIVGVYENPFLADELAKPPAPGQILSPQEMHFWIRKVVSDAVAGESLRGFSRLTSRGNRKIEDDRIVFPNFPNIRFLWKLMSSGLCVLNTYPHAVYPWKAFESLALGVPYIIEAEPLIEIPDAFRPQKGKHFLEILPGNAEFRKGFDLEEPATYRTLVFPGADAIEEGLLRIGESAAKPSYIGELQRNARRFAKERLDPRFLVDWLSHQIEGS